MSTMRDRLHEYRIRNGLIDYIDDADVLAFAENEVKMALAGDAHATTKLGDCRGFIEAVNEACTCGGNGPGEGCPACEVFHAVKDWEVRR